MHVLLWFLSFLVCFRACLLLSRVFLFIFQFAFTIMPFAL